MSHILHFLLALEVVGVLALLVSHDRKSIRIRYIVQLLVIEVLMAWFFLKGFAGLFDHLLKYAGKGINYKILDFFFLNVLHAIVFISALISILQHFQILPWVIRDIGIVLSKVNGMGKLESFNAVSSLILGQSENFMSIRIFSAKCRSAACTTLLRPRCRPLPCRLSAMLQPKIIGTQSLVNAGICNPVYALRNGTTGWTLACQVANRVGVAR